MFKTIFIAAVVLAIVACVLAYSNEYEKTFKKILRENLPNNKWKSGKAEDPANDVIKTYYLENVVYPTLTSEDCAKLENFTWDTINSECKPQYTSKEKSKIIKSAKSLDKDHKYLYDDVCKEISKSDCKQLPTSSKCTYKKRECVWNETSPTKDFFENYYSDTPAPSTTRAGSKRPRQGPQ